MKPLYFMVHFIRTDEAGGKRLYGQFHVWTESREGGFTERRNMMPDSIQFFDGNGTVMEYRNDPAEMSASFRANSIKYDGPVRIKADMDNDSPDPYVIESMKPSLCRPSTILRIPMSLVTVSDGSRILERERDGMPSAVIHTAHINEMELDIREEFPVSLDDLREVKKSIRNAISRIGTELGEPGTVIENAGRLLAEAEHLNDKYESRKIFYRKYYDVLDFDGKYGSIPGMVLVDGEMLDDEDMNGLFGRCPRCGQRKVFLPRAGCPGENRECTCGGRFRWIWLDDGTGTTNTTSVKWLKNHGFRPVHAPS